MDFATMMKLDRTAADTYVGTGAQYPWGGLYGGHIIAQALRAAAATVDDTHHPHSLHAYYIRRGDQDAPVTYEVDELRDGRSFVTRRVVARQASGAILNLAASFQITEDQASVQAATMPDLPGPDELAHDSWSPMFDRAVVTRTEPGHAAAWLRVTDALGDDALLHACALAYLSDDFPTDTVFTHHPDARDDGHDDADDSNSNSNCDSDGNNGADTDGDDDRWDRFMSASLDHAVWFHRPMRADEWHLHDFTCDVLEGARGLSIGRIFTAEGVHVATAVQEVLVRRVEPPAGT